MRGERPERRCDWSNPREEVRLSVRVHLVVFCRIPSTRAAVALPCLALTLTILGCGGASRLSYDDNPTGPLARTTPALSVAGIAHFDCVDRRVSPLLKIGIPGEARFDREEDPGAQPSPGLGQIIVEEFGCTRYAVEIAIPLPLEGPGDLATPHGLYLTREAFDSLVPPGSERGMLWSIADALRLSPKEPFVFGFKREISEDESVSLRFDSSSGGRLMLVYRLSL